MFYSVGIVGNLYPGYMQRNHDDNGELYFSFEYDREIQFVEFEFVTFLNINDYEVSVSYSDSNGVINQTPIDIYRGNEWIENFYVSDKVQLKNKSHSVMLKFKTKAGVDFDGSPVGIDGTLNGWSMNPPPYKMKSSKVSSSMSIEEIINQHNLLVDDVEYLISLGN